jgi:hypothetical protein
MPAQPGNIAKSAAMPAEIRTGSRIAGKSREHRLKALLIPQFSVVSRVAD